MDITLDLDDAALLRRILASAVSDIHSEIGATEDRQMRSRLKADEARMMQLLVRCGGSVDDTTMSIEALRRSIGSRL